MKLFSPSISFNIFLGIANKHFYHKLKGSFKESNFLRISIEIPPGI